MAGTSLKVLLLVLSVSFLVAHDLFCSQQWSMTAPGERHTLGLMANGSLYAWGDNYYSQLGFPVGADEFKKYQTPIPVMPEETFKFVATKYHTSIAITTDGRLFLWGKRLTDPDGIKPRQETPVQVGNDSDWKMVTAGKDHALALKENGKLYAWGSSSFGQLGHGGKTDYFAVVKSPVPVVPETFTWKTIAAGKWRSYAIRDDDTLFAWGYNRGNLGDGTQFDRELPVRIGGPGFSTVSAGYKHALAIDTKGNLYTWGDNDWGQLGLSEKEKQSVVPVIPEALKNMKWKGVAAGELHSIALRDDGTLWAFGNGYDGQLGNGKEGINNMHNYTPVQIAPNQTWKSITAGIIHTFGITPEGNLLGWGNNYGGQLGDENEKYKRSAPESCPAGPKSEILRQLSSQIRKLFKARQ